MGGSGLAYGGVVKRSRMILLAVAGILLPVALAFTAYVISSSIGASATNLPIPGENIEAPGHIESSPSESEDVSPTRSDEGPSPTDAQGGGRCSEAEHSSDPTCTSASSASPKGSGSDDVATLSPTEGKSSEPGTSGSGSSGSGSDGPRPGSGGDD